MVNKLNFDSGIFRTLILIFLAASLIVLIFIASGYFITPYYLHFIRPYTMCMVGHSLIVLVLYILEKNQKHSRHQNARLLKHTCYISLLATLIMYVFSK